MNDPLSIGNWTTEEPVRKTHNKYFDEIDVVVFAAGLVAGLIFGLLFLLGVTV